MGITTVWKGDKNLHFTYASSSGEVTEREVIARRIVREGASFRLTAYCLLREDEREFRVDCIQGDVTDTETGENAPLSHLLQFDPTPQEKPQPAAVSTATTAPREIRLKNPRKRPPYGLPAVPSTQNLHVEDITDYKDVFQSIREPDEIREMSKDDFLEELDGLVELEVDEYTDFVERIVAKDKLPEGISGQDIVEAHPEDDPIYFLLKEDEPARESPLFIDSGMPGIDDLVRSLTATELKEWAKRFGLKASGRKQEIAERLIAAGVDLGLRVFRMCPTAALERHAQLSQQYIDEIRRIGEDLPSAYRQALWAEVALQRDLTDDALHQATETLATQEAERPKPATRSTLPPTSSVPKAQQKAVQHRPQTDFSHGRRNKPPASRREVSVIGWLLRLFGR